MILHNAQLAEIEKEDVGLVLKNFNGPGYASYTLTLADVGRKVVLTTTHWYFERKENDNHD